MHPVGIPHAKLLTKFEVCSPNNFQDIWDRLPQILGSRDLGHAPFGKIIGAPARLFQEEDVYKFKVSSSSNFEDMYDCMTKSLGVT